jgi:probable F420-dependent oxidoreductase
MIRVAQRAEQRGYDSLWTFQRVLSPVGGGRHEPIVEQRNPSTRPVDDPAYLSVHDAVLPLAYVAGHTGSIRLGTATVCAPFTPPALLAKAMATLDHLSHGRLTVGVGMGWMPQEYVAAGVPLQGRGARMDEYLRCLVAVWTEDPVEFHGDHYDVPLSHVAPRPVQRPHPPVLVGGAAPAALRRAGRLAQGWIASASATPERIEESIEHVRAGAREAGRDPDAVHVLARAVVSLVEDDQGEARAPFHGTREQVLDDLAALRGRGVTEVLVDLNFAPGIGTPFAAAEAATAEAERVLDALGPHQVDS